MIKSETYDQEPKLNKTKSEPTWTWFWFALFYYFLELLKTLKFPQVFGSWNFILSEPLKHCVQIGF